MTRRLEVPPDCRRHDGHEESPASLDRPRPGRNRVTVNLPPQHLSGTRDHPFCEGENDVFKIGVLQQATDNFSEEKILGKGGFSVVYKGKLDHGTEIAVKRMKDTTETNDLNKEIAVLQEVSHRHLVAFLGSCINDNEKFLVYEYMPQGTLAQHLFESSEQRYPVLTWNQRIIIALDVALGVEYLHGLPPQGFIHRDLKPSNILLGDDMRAKVADFGLIKLAPEGNHSTQTRVAGTPGYIAPEYATTEKVTKKVDVYAFGVILLEIITGRKALDNTLPSERRRLVTYFQKVIINKKKLPEAIDKTLNRDKDTLVSIWKVAKLARRCTCNRRSKRPDIGDVVNKLGRLVDQGKRSRRGEEDTSGINFNTCLPHFLQR